MKFERWAKKIKVVEKIQVSCIFVKSAGTWDQHIIYNHQRNKLTQENQTYSKKIWEKIFFRFLVPRYEVGMLQERMCPITRNDIAWIIAGTWKWKEIINGKYKEKLPVYLENADVEYVLLTFAGKKGKKDNFYLKIGYQR